MVSGWKDRTPDGFVFAAKIPRVITHQKVLSDCQRELSSFLKVMETLGDKLGPLLLQFPYFNKNVFASREQFDKLLRPFLDGLPKGFRFSVEIRNKNWISWDFLELLRDRSVGFTLLAQAWMPPNRYACEGFGFGHRRFLLCPLHGRPQRAGKPDAKIRQAFG